MDYRREQAAIERIRRHAPHLYVDTYDHNYIWLWKWGYHPEWLDRVVDVDVSGTTGGRNINGLKLPLDFDDEDFAAIQEDLHKFEDLEELYLQCTAITDKSVPALSRLKHLKRLKFINLQQTGITSAEVRKLEKDLPNVKIAFFHDLVKPWQ